MGKIIIDISMSVDGFIAGQNMSAKLPMGDSGLELHNWLFHSKTATDEKVIQETVANAGAVIVGGNTYKFAIEEAWEGVSPFTVPAFVLLQTAPAIKIDGFNFISGGIEDILQHAKAEAGDKNIWVMGGANIIQQFIKARLFDELHVHLAPLILGKGIKLFGELIDEKIKLENIEMIQTPAATHLKFKRL